MDPEEAIRDWMKLMRAVSKYANREAGSDDGQEATEGPGGTIQHDTQD